jgi:oxygen-independent coproporphyrinogen III oxidase
MGLRLTHTGLNRKRFQGRFGISPEQLYPSEVEKLELDGLLEMTPDALRLTSRGRLLGNRVFAEFIS